jgi:hypothetical protein
MAAISPAKGEKSGDSAENTGGTIKHWVTSFSLMEWEIIVTVISVICVVIGLMTTGSATANLARVVYNFYMLAATGFLVGATYTGNQDAILLAFFMIVLAVIFKFFAGNSSGGVALLISALVLWFVVDATSPYIHKRLQSTSKQFIQ